ncbi:zinc finger protein ZPR1 [Onthophagus taurus]|uniref:zinc finger protein ZPR1 n=1 Tax=Onthophagus taurus TaxID=166361 RepID=UPI000C204D78|nr:zinc finger protein ZPR1 [Onthophagus taurus]
MCSNGNSIFKEFNADELANEATVVESLCMQCYGNGITRLLLTKIPYYKDVVISSFTCKSCGYWNNEIKPGGPIPEKGIRYNLNVCESSDLNRKVVKSDYASVKILELDFEVPAKSQKGEITTVEGVIDRSISGLKQDQDTRRVEHPDIAKQIDEFVGKLEKLKNLESPFTLILDDISGNSFIENPFIPGKDPRCIIHNYIRTKEQDHELGVFTHEEVDENNPILHPIQENENLLQDLQGEVLQFPTNCNNCGALCETNMKVTNIPHFKDVVIMATLCEKCGNRTNEVKSGGGIEPHGVHIEVDIHGKEDFSRDLLKSETCSLSIPQLDLEVGPWALGGRFTTVEGLLTAVKDQLSDPRYNHMVGDSQDTEQKDKLQEFMTKFNEILEGKRMVTVILDDPAGNSYIQSLKDDDQLDDNLRVTKYERNFDQNEELGLNDMKTENYEEN